MQHSTAKTDRLTRAAARNPGAWQVSRLGPVLFGATCEASGDRFEVVSAYGVVHFVENMGGSGKTYRVDDNGCECPSFQHREGPYGCVCKHAAAVIAVRRFKRTEAMVDAGRDPFADDAPVAVAARDEVIVLGDAAKAASTARFVEEMFA